ncbi:NADPH:quinone oxidoreductase family protein [Myxococcota bacterium]|nr:NADPH:quinone oxidoreductase family protein [Myxococcota bacterium]
MKAVVCKEFGPPEKLLVEDMPDPEAGPGQVVIDVKAAAVTFPDTLMIEDKYQFKAAPPFIPGGEVAGIISAVGEGVEGFAEGDRVVGSAGIVGGFAEKAAVPALSTRKIPDGADFAEATGLLYAYGTGYYGLHHRGQLQPGETLLVLGAGGNVGLAAVELGKMMGARVIAAASSDEKLALCRERGADASINYSTENLKERAKALTDGHGCDVVYDAVGGDYAEAAIRATAWGGRFLVIGFTAGIPRIPLNLTLLKSCQIVGVFYGAMVAREPETRDAIARDLLQWTAEGQLSPHVSRRYSLDKGPQALRDMIDRKAVGRIVVEP